ncbi:MAG: TIGR03013 family PEP-CTERM/XrtA system glycosyltransferase [Rhodospirillales bacterium]|nr:MAG: TIGR03013 family PEP-CTERM/XrtA system glycosyltransferase [Rhodospirillales bacterium]
MKIVAALEFATDFIAAAGAMYLIYGSHYFFSLRRDELLLQAGIFALVFLLARFAMGLYQWQCCSELKEVFARAIAAYACGFLVLSVIYYLVPGVQMWRSAAAVSVPAALIAVLTTRYLLDHGLQGRLFIRRILVMGVGERAARIEALEQRKGQHSFICVGFLRLAGETCLVSPSRVVANINSLTRYVEANEVDEIVIAPTDRRGTLPMQALVECRLSGTRIRTYQMFLEKETGRVDPDSLQPDWFLYSEGFRSRGLQEAIKRGFDILASVVLILLALPLLISTIIAVKIEGGGPIFYKQERIGLKGKAFLLFKFRSMQSDAEHDGTPQWARVNDQRVTTVGQLIRKTRIDELPQLFNVLKGDMSFVGPRPERGFFVEQLSQQIPYYNERHEVKPGITGWAQLNYSYGASVEDAKEKLAFDLYYIKYYSVIRDIVIIFQTVRVVLWPQGVR